MKRTLIHPEPDAFPAPFRPLLEDVPVYDSSCSPAARVWYIDREGGFYLKSAPRGTLKREAELTRFFCQKGLGAEVLAYESGEWDWLLTARIPGEDCIHPQYLADPKRLCDTLAEVLRMLHDRDSAGCPVPHRTAEYLAAAAANYEKGHCDLHLFPPGGAAGGSFRRRKRGTPWSGMAPA